MLVGVLVSLQLTGSSRSADLREPGPSTTSIEDGRDARAAELVEQLEEALSSRRRGEAASLTSNDDERARRELLALASTAKDLDLEAVGLRFVSEGSSLTTGERERYGSDAFLAEVELSWQLADFDPRPSSVETTLVLSDDGRRSSFVTARARPSARAPIWFNDRVRVERPTEDVLVVRSTGAAAPALSDLAVTGASIVRAALPRWDGRAVVEAPRDVKRFARASGLATESAKGIAAVTTSSDGTDIRGGPERVLLNPAVFGPLGRVGQQIVMSHELTHVAVDGATSAMPLWLSEGYADYVALRRSDLPVRTLSAQIRTLVRTQGAPAALPRAAQFDGSDPDVGAWYESSWLAARLLAEEYGEASLDAFYRQADRDGGTDAAFRRLGTTERAFTRLWRAELERLAE